MFIDRNTLHTSLMGLTGFHQTDNPEYPNLAASLLESRSNRYIQDEHPLLTIENIDQCVKNFSHFNYTAYSGSTTYSKYDKVSYNSSFYEYISDTSDSGNLPTDTDYWSGIDSLSDYLIQMDYKATDMALDAVINTKKVKGQVKSIFNNVRLFNGPARTTNLITNDGKLVGLYLRIKDYRSLVGILEKIGHQFNGALTDMPIYVWHSSLQAPLYSLTFNHSTGKNMEWKTLTGSNTLRSWSDSFDTGGFFLIGYFQDDLDTVKAIKKDIVWDLFSPCCDVKEQYRQYAPFYEVYGFYFNSTDLDGTNLPDIDKMVIDYNSNYGLNLEITTKCDLGPFIIQQEDLISQVKSLSFAWLLLSMMANSTRNGLSEKVKDLAKKELVSFKDVYGTVNDRLNTAVKALNFDLSGLDDVCLPCDTMTIDIDAP